jgi:tRNA pseudouridine38-40 synthase
LRTLRLIIEYNGKGLSGFQLQSQLPADKTVQGALEKALERMTQHPVRLRAASRTDAGVHARGQVVAFETDRDRIPCEGFARGVNDLLPEGIVVRAAEEAPPGWHPRRQARGKHYRYVLWVDPYPTAIDAHRVWWRSQPLDLEAMNQAGSLLLGTHDFEAFRSAGCSAHHAMRTLYRVEVVPGPRSEVHIEVLGNAFVRNMVRIIAGNLVEVGQGRRAPESLGVLLASRDRTQGGMTAPASGLCLEEVIYDDRLPPRPKNNADHGPG